MPFPVILDGPPGEHWNIYASTAQRYPLGTQLIHQTGRKFRFAQAGGTLLVRATLQQAAAPLANHLNVVQTAGEATVAGQRYINIDIVTAEDITADMYGEGFINISDGTGEGFIYGIASHDTNTAEDTTLTRFDFVPGDTIQIATAVATDVSLIKNPYDATVIYPTAATSIPVGVALRPIAVNGHGWLQTRGPASVLTDGTLVVGLSVQPSNGTAGSVEAWGLTEAAPPTQITAEVGWVMHLAATAEHSTIFLIIDG
jgi:hypothetical protein